MRKLVSAFSCLDYRLREGAPICRTGLAQRGCSKKVVVTFPACSARANRTLQPQMRCSRLALGACLPRFRAGFTLLELLLVILVVGVLVAIILPGLPRARQLALGIGCLNHLRQQGMAWHMYLAEHGARFADRRDLKTSLPSGYRPCSDWPPSDPRAGRAAVVLADPLTGEASWSCPGARWSPLGDRPQVKQQGGANPSAPIVRYWMWRFDRVDEPVLADNFWGRKESKCVAMLGEAGHPMAGRPQGPAEVELVADVYFPGNLTSAPPEWRGRAAHPRGRNRLMMDGHAGFYRDIRLYGH